MKKGFFILLLSLSIFLSQCKEDCHEVPSLGENPLLFYVVDSVTGINLIKREKDSIGYHIDSVEFLNEDKVNITDLLYKEFDQETNTYVLGIWYLSRQMGVENKYQSGEQTYYLSFNNSDIDTINIKYDYDPGKNIMDPAFRTAV